MALVGLAPHLVPNQRRESVSMPTSPLVLLRTAVEAQIETAAGIAIEPRYVPHFDADEIREPKWVLLLGADDLELSGRELARGELAVDIGLQAAVPKKTNREDELITAAWCDARVNDLETIKALYSPGGDLYEAKPIDGATFRRWVNTPVYLPDLLFDNKIFTGVIRLVFSYERN